MRLAPDSPSLKPLTTLALGLILFGGGWGRCLRAEPEQKVTSVRRDPDASTHARFLQSRNGVRIWGGEGITHARPTGKQYLVTNPLKVEVEVGISTTPSLTPAEALWVVAHDLERRGPLAAEPRTELVILPDVERIHRVSGLPIRADQELNAIDVVERVTGYRLAYHIEAAFNHPQDGPSLTAFLVDAHGGTILRQWNALQTASGTGNSQYSGTVQLSTATGGQGFELRDLDRGSHTTVDMNHSTDMAFAGSLYTDPDNVWGDGQQYVLGAATTSTNGQTAAVDAHYGTQVTWDFYQKVLSRNGIDDKGTPTRVRVHFDNQYDNAFWWDACFCLTFGDGNRFKTLTSLDVVGHEFSHGVTATTAGLIYMGESGSLNEATSDIFGTMIEFYSRGAGAQGVVVPDAGGDWTIGEQIKTPAFDRPLRYMYKPSLDGASPDAWSASLSYLDVHYGSGPMNRCFYFLSQGASANSTSTSYSSYLPAGMTGVGNDKATRIWYRALSTYLTSSSNYLHARMAALRAAIDLHGAGSPEFQAVRNAFAAINVGYASGAGDDLVPPVVSASVTGASDYIQFTANASDNTGVGTLIFYVDQNRVGTLDEGGQSSATGVLAFDSRTIPNGDHLLSIAAIDTVGNIAHSASVPFHLSNSFYELLLQGDFEYGSVFSGGVDQRNMAWVDPLEVINGDWPYLGWWGADFCGLGTANTRSIYQTVTIPATAQQAILSFWLQVFSQEPTDRPRDTFQVQVRSTAGELLETLATYSNLDQISPHVIIPVRKEFSQHFLDLTAYRGRTIQLRFEGQEDAAHATSVSAPAVPPVGMAEASRLLPVPGHEGSISGQRFQWPGVTSYPWGVGLTEFLLDNVSLRVRETADTIPPSASARPFQETFGTLNLVADVSDNLVIARVDYLIDGAVVGSTAAGPHKYHFDSRTLPDGPHTFTVDAYDLAGNKGSSGPVAFRTDNTFSQLLKNPTFWLGDVDWTFTNWGLMWISYINDPEVMAVVANGASMGAAVPAALTQPVSIPANAQSARLKVSYGMQSLSNPPDDALRIQIRDANGLVKATLATIPPPDTTPYYGDTDLDLMAYRGQDVVVALVVNTLAIPASGSVKGLIVNLYRADLVVQSSALPVILAQPISRAVLIGSPVTFSVTASGAGSLSYQWRKDTVAIPGANSPTLSIASVIAGDAGSYDVVVTNTQGSTLSAAATLTVGKASLDLNGDGVVNVLDLAHLMRSHAPGVNAAGSLADLNGDGFVDDADLALLLAQM